MWPNQPPYVHIMATMRGPVARIDTTAEGFSHPAPQEAFLGDWVVRQPIEDRHNRFAVLTDDAFRALFTPVKESKGKKS